MKCKDKGEARVCTAGGRTFTLRDRKRKGRSTRSISKFKFTKADARACAKHKNPKARGKCMAGRVRARVG